MMCKELRWILPFFCGIFLILAGCDTGDDLSEPLPGPGPIEEWTYNISGMAVLGEDDTYILDSWGDQTLIQTEYYAVIEDTVILKGFQWPGGAILQKDAIFSPLYPALNTEWWGLDSHKFTVVDSADVTVPAGTFPAFLYERSDSLSEEPVATMILAQDVGILAIEWIEDGSPSLTIVLDDYTINGGEGVFPLDMGNSWTLVEGEYTIEE